LVQEKKEEMFIQNISHEVWGGASGKYRLRDEEGNPIDQTPEDTCRRVAAGLAAVEKNPEEWENRFAQLLLSGKFAGGGRIMANIGGGNLRKKTSPINCVVASQIIDSLGGILSSVKNAGEVLSAGCGVGYDFSSLRPKGAYVGGVGSETSGVISFMKVFDATCSTIMSGGCFAGDTRILTTRGLIPIKEIVESEDNFYAHTHLGPKKITTKFDNGIKKLYTVTLESGQSIKITKEHKVAHFDQNGEIVTSPISEFAVGDKILAFSNDYENDFNYIDLGEGFALNEDFAYWIGVYFGDGHNIKREDGEVKGFSVVFSADNNGIKSLKKVKEVLTSYGLNAIFNDRRIAKTPENCMTLKAYSRKFIKLLERNNLLKQKSKYIKIPELIFRSNSKVQKAFCAGFFDADGSARTTKRGQFIATISKQFAEEYQVLLTSFGVMSKMRKEDRSKRGWNDLYTVSVSGRTWQKRMNSVLAAGFKKLAKVATRDMRYNYPNIISEIEDFKNKEFKGLWTRNKRRGVPNSVSRRILEELRPDSEYLGVVPMRIISIEELGEENVYDLEVEEAHLLSGNGIYTSNSRRGAQLAALDIQHPEIENFISCKRQDGVLRYFNLSILISDKFMEAVQNNDQWTLWFWEKTKEVPDQEILQVIPRDYLPFDFHEANYFTFGLDHEEVLGGNCTTETFFKKRIYKILPARALFEQIMRSTYDFAEPGMLFIDRINIENVLYFCEQIRASNPCGEQILAPSNCCDLGSMILPKYISYMFSENATFNWVSFRNDIRIANRMLDNVVDVNNLPLPELRRQIELKRRHGLGFTGLGTIFNMLGIAYGSEESIEFVEKLMLIMAQESLVVNINLAQEKGPAPIFSTVAAREAAMESGFLKRLLPTFGENERDVRASILKFGLRFSHSTSIAPTGTMSLTWGNNCSNGIEPSFTNAYMRNIRRQNKKTKTQEEVMSLEYFLWVNEFKDRLLPEHWRTTDNLKVGDHIAIQAAAQKWCDSSISKTVNIPTDYPFEEFKKVYFAGWKAGLKGMTTFRFNPEAFSGVLVRKEDLARTQYTFVLEDGSEITVSGDETVEYDGEEHNAANLFDAFKEGMYGDM